jgi:DNA-binding MarR family transcriptional regulator
MERTTLTRNLKLLIDAGLIGVERGGDRRVRTIVITAKGYRAAVAALPHWRSAQRAVASQFTTDVFDSLADVTQRLSRTRTPTRGARPRRAKETRT